MSKSVIAIIMAGGLGKRMESTIPKVLMEISGIPMIVRIIKQLEQLSSVVHLEKILVVVGKYEQQIKAVIHKYINSQSKQNNTPNSSAIPPFKSFIATPDIVYVKQPESLGTGHAIMCCKEELLTHTESEVLILSGDVPMLTANTMNELLELSSPIKLITTRLTDPHGYGRIVTTNKRFNKIVEHKDCTEEQLDITQINAGIYSIKSDFLCRNFQHLKNDNNQSEYYLTDMIEIIKREEQVEVLMLDIPTERTIEIMGVNTIHQLRELEELFQFVS